MQKGAKMEPKSHQNASQNSPPGRAGPTAGVCWASKCLRASFPRAPFPAVGLFFAVFIIFVSRRFHPGSLPFPPLSVVFWSPFRPSLAFFGSLFLSEYFYLFFLCFLMSVWFIIWINVTCFSHTCSNSVFAYFFLGCFSNVCTLSKHGIFKTHCFFSSKNVILEEPPLQKKFENLDFWGWDRALFLA